MLFSLFKRETSQNNKIKVIKYERKQVLSKCNCLIDFKYTHKKIFVNTGKTR